MTITSQNDDEKRFPKLDKQRMSDSEAAAFYAEQRKKFPESSVPSKYSEEEQAIILAKYDSDDELASQFPDRDGSEFAMLKENGDISVHFGANDADGSHGSGSRTYSPDHKDFKAMWKRHKFDDPKGKMHFIAQKWSKEKGHWIDLGDKWISE